MKNGMFKLWLRMKMGFTLTIVRPVQKFLESFKKDWVSATVATATAAVVIATTAAVINSYQTHDPRLDADLKALNAQYENDSSTRAAKTEWDIEVNDVQLSVDESKLQDSVKNLVALNVELKRDYDTAHANHRIREASIHNSANEDARKAFNEYTKQVNALKTRT